MKNVRDSRDTTETSKDRGIARLSGTLTGQAPTDEGMLVTRGQLVICFQRMSLAPIIPSNTALREEQRLAPY